jgi:hypothetical protein
MEKSEKIKQQFEALHAAWLKIIQDPKIQFSSRPQDYTNNQPYREMIKMGKDALPLILEKIEQGEFLLNEAALKVAELDLGEVVEEEANKPALERVPFMLERKPVVLSEQQKSKLILKYAKK